MSRQEKTVCDNCGAVTRQRNDPAYLGLELYGLGDHNVTADLCGVACLREFSPRLAGLWTAAEGSRGGRLADAMTSGRVTADDVRAVARAELGFNDAQADAYVEAWPRMMRRLCMRAEEPQPQPVQPWRKAEPPMTPEPIADAELRALAIDGPLPWQMQELAEAMRVGRVTAEDLLAAAREELGSNDAPIDAYVEAWPRMMRRLCMRAEEPQPQPWTRERITEAVHAVEAIHAEGREPK